MRALSRRVRERLGFVVGEVGITVSRECAECRGAAPVVVPEVGAPHAIMRARD